MAYRMSGLRVVNQARGLPGRAGLGYIAPEQLIVHGRTSQATATDFSRNRITMPLFGRGGLSGYSYGSQPRKIGLWSPTSDQILSNSYGSQPQQYGGASGLTGIDMPDWLRDAAGYVGQIAGQIAGQNVEENPATAAIENQENQEGGTPVGGALGMSTNTLLLLGAAAVAIYFVAKK